MKDTPRREEFAVDVTPETIKLTPVGAPQPEQLKIVIVGHVDHGKSTLVG